MVFWLILLTYSWILSIPEDYKQTRFKHPINVLCPWDDIHFFVVLPLMYYSQSISKKHIIVQNAHHDWLKKRKRHVKLVQIRKRRGMNSNKSLRYFRLPIITYTFTTLHHPCFLLFYFFFNAQVVYSNFRVSVFKLLRRKCYKKW